MEKFLNFKLLNVDYHKMLLLQRKQNNWEKENGENLSINLPC